MKLTRTVTIVTALSIGLTGSAALAHGKDGSKGQMRFETLDTDSDGKLSRAEMDAGAAARFAAMDANADGKITAEEMTQGRKARAERRFGKMLERLDADKDGALSFEEMAAGPRHKEMFDRLDADDDGFVTKAEMGKMRKMRGHGGKRSD